jgi:phage terminase large subunit
MATVGKIKNEYEETNYEMRPCAILIDVVGLGAGVYDRCKELGLPVKAIPTLTGRPSAFASVAVSA